jgi:hypothetical protein
MDISPSKVAGLEIWTAYQHTFLFQMARLAPPRLIDFAMTREKIPPCLLGWVRNGSGPDPSLPGWA